MKTILALSLFVLSINAFSQGIGNCKILEPNRMDRNGRFCDHGFGVTYNGFKINTSCYENIDRAFNVMSATIACSNPVNLGNCSLLMPNRSDKSKRICDKKFGVTYLGHKVDTFCYDTLQEASDVMNAVQSCMKPSKLNDCKILMPNQVDKSNRYCEKSFGVTHEGFKINTECYSTIDEAMNVMETTKVCQI